MPLADRLKAARLRAGLSQRGAAKKLGIAGPSVAQWESGRTRPDLGRISAVAALYGVPWLSLLDEMPPGEALFNEAEIVALFRSLPLDDQRAILTLIRTLTNKKAA